MKAPVLGLIVAAGAFGASSLYLWNELSAERARADELVAKSELLNARIAELERSRTQFAQQRLASANTFGGASIMQGGPDRPLAAAVEDGKPGPGEVRWNMRPSPERSEAMKKMMRAQIRANNKHLYADVGSQLGLSKDQANKLVDLLTDQSVAAFGQRREARDANEAQTSWEELQRQQKTELTDLLGADKVASLEEYQKTLPARQEVDMFSRQLEGYDAPLTDDQRKRLITVFAEERDRVPAPQYTDGTDMEEYRKARVAWEQDYNERVSSQASSILNTQQASVYTEYQQAQQEMRAQFVPFPGGRRMRGGVAGGNMGYSTVAAPAGGVFVDAVIVNAPPDPEKK